MPASNTIVSNLMAAITVVMIWGCGSGRTVPRHGGSPTQIGSVSSLQRGLSLAVWLEDQCESREGDERSLTLLEALHDGLAFPTEVLFAVAVVTIAGSAWNLYDRIALLAGEPLPNRPEMVMAYIRPHRAGPK